MLESISELTNARPHMRKTARFTPAEYAIYAEGYYTGLIMALRVADLAIGRFALAGKVRRAERRRKVSA